MTRLPDRATTQTRLQCWTEQIKASGLHGLDPFFNTWHRWQDGILNDFEGGHNSGFIEGLNHKLKWLKRRCFGLDDPTKPGYRGSTPLGMNPYILWSPWEVSENHKNMRQLVPKDLMFYKSLPITL